MVSLLRLQLLLSLLWLGAGGWCLRAGSPLLALAVALHPGSHESADHRSALRVAGCRKRSCLAEKAITGLSSQVPAGRMPQGRPSTRRGDHRSAVEDRCRKCRRKRRGLSLRYLFLEVLCADVVT